jgi:hypothetical protein
MMATWKFPGFPAVRTWSEGRSWLMSLSTRTEIDGPNKPDADNPGIAPAVPLSRLTFSRPGVSDWRR